jgi:D-tyrosyl-tRNA(Tyr) deacylase
VLQRVSQASVTVEGREVGRIGHGLLALVGVAAGDTEEDARALAKKTAEVRIFSDAEGRFNLSVQDVGGAVLVVSQFTLLADARKGRRPSFTEAAPPDLARPLVDCYAEALRGRGLTVATGRFGAHMDVALVNDGPVTLLLDTRV